MSDTSGALSGSSAGETSYALGKQPTMTPYFQFLSSRRGPVNQPAEVRYESAADPGVMSESGPDVKIPNSAADPGVMSESGPDVKIPNSAADPRASTRTLR